MNELVRWLGEQLDKDERLARSATRGPWVQSGIGDYGWTVDFGRPGSGVETADTDQGLADADFIAAHNPARVLREIEAKREVLRQHQRLIDISSDDLSGLTAMEAVIRSLAAVYADRPGYRKDWRP